MSTTIASSIANGTIALPEKMISAEAIEWTKHASFEGVYLKHLVRGENTNGQLSCHMVRIDPGCALETHVHAAQWELHEVIEGTGTCNLNGSTVLYGVGQMAVIPSGTPHAVKAGESGLILLAKFFPALI